MWSLQASLPPDVDLSIRKITQHSINICIFIESLWANKFDGLKKYIFTHQQTRYAALVGASAPIVALVSLPHC